MKIQILLFYIIIIGATACKPAKTPSESFLKEESKVLLGQEGTSEFFYWEIENDERLWGEELGEVDGITEFRASLKIKLGELRYRATIEKESTQSLDKGIPDHEIDGDSKNALLVHTGNTGKIRVINHLEAQILNYQIVKYPLLSHPTEFHGFIVYNPKKNKFRIYYGASDSPWPPHPDLLLVEIEKDIKNGWLLKYHLHNHYEPASNNYLGILAPSLADAQYYKMLSENFDIEKALITNGFHTLVIDAIEFTEFESH